MSGEVFGWREAPRADFAVIGDPVKHSLSPKMHSAAYAEAILDLRYVAIQVSAGEVAPALSHLADLGYRGVNVTVPHKEEVLDWCRDVDPFAQRVRAANTLRLSDRTAINTDGPGFLETLYGVSKRADQHVVMLGAGGSARAIGQALVDAGFPLAIYNRTPERAEALVSALGSGARMLTQPDLTGAFLVVNTTSASLTGDRLPLDWGHVSPDALAYDLMYTQGLTPFLDEARAAGLEVRDGRDLLVAQGALSFEFWLKQKPSKRAMREAIA